MLQRFASDLSRQDFLACGVELASVLGMDRDAAGERIDAWPDDVERFVASIDNPVLLTDAWRLAELAPRLRDTVFKLLESPVRTTEFRGVRLTFEQARWPGVWGPNIDTLLCCRALGDHGVDGVESAVELGSGSGFISKFLLTHAPKLRAMTLVDRHAGAAACSRANVPDARAEVICGDATTALAGRRFDLVVTNPPYIPRPRSIADNAYEGVDLLAFLTQQGADMLTPGGRIVTITSSLSAHLFEPMVAKSSLRARTLSTTDVPLKVLNVLNNAEWLDYLRKARGVRCEVRDGYELWHEIRVVALEACATL